MLHGEVEGEGVGQQRADEQVGVAVERDGGDLELAAGEEPWVGLGGDVGVEVGLVERFERQVGLVDDRDARLGDGGEGVRVVGGEVGVAAGVEVVRRGLAGLGEREFAFEDVEEALRGALNERALGVELDGHLREGRAGGGCDVHDGQAAGQAGERRADEGVRREQEVVAPVGAAGLAEMVHKALIVGQEGANSEQLSANRKGKSNCKSFNAEYAE